MLVRKKKYIRVPVLNTLTFQEVKQIIKDEVATRSTVIGWVKACVNNEDVVTGEVILNYVHLQAIVPAPMRETFALRVGGKIKTEGDQAIEVSLNLYPAPIVYVANMTGLISILFCLLFLIYWTSFILPIAGVFGAMTISIYAAGLLVDDYSKQELEILAKWVEKLETRFKEPSI
jgi:hypothetical protein